MIYISVMARTRQNPEDSHKRALILQTASKMFMSQGYTSVSMDMLADAAPVSKRTLYNHFKDKKALFTAVMEGRCALLFDKLEKSLHGKESVEKTLTSIANQFLDLVMAQDSVNLYRTAITESQHFPELGSLFYESGPKRAKAVLASYFRMLADRGELAIANPDLASGMFLNMLTGRIHMQRLLGVKKNVTAREKKDIVEYAVSVFLYGQEK